MKKILASATALALTLTMSTAAFAASYTGTITVNGNKLDTAKAPATTLAGGIPMRAVVESDYGFADWYPDESKTYFAMDGVSIYVDSKTAAIELNGETVKGVKAEFVNGTTFLPVSVLKDLPGYTVTTSGKDVTLVTPNSEPMTKLARSIITKVDMGASMKSSVDEMEQNYGLKKDTFTSLVGFFPMMISADTVVIGKVAPGKMEEAKKALEARRAATQQNFEQYLPGPLEVAKNGKVVTSGDYIMLILSSDNDTAIQMFKDGVKDLK